MAQIDIQQKHGSSSWIWWLIGIIVLALIVWWIVAANRDDNTATAEVTTPATGVATGVAAVPATGAYANTGSAAGATGGTITDLSTLTSGGSDLVGRSVALTGVPVARAVSDKGFWAGTGEGAGQGVFVVRGNQNASYTAPNGAVVAGKSVNIFGTVQAMPSDLTEQNTAWKLSSTDRSKLAQQQVYISADSVRIASSS